MKFVDIHYFFTDPIVTIVPPVIVIRVDDAESLVHVTCSPSHPDLPVRWMAGSEDITANTTELTLFPQNVHHTLAIDLSSGIELGDIEFSCLLDNPEDSEEVVATDAAMVRIVPSKHTIPYMNGKISLLFRCMYNHH